MAPGRPARAASLLTAMVVCTAMAAGACAAQALGAARAAAATSPVRPADAVATVGADAAVAVEPATHALPQPLTSQPGDAARGRSIVASRQTGLCLLCHRAPIAEVALQGNLSTDLSGAGARWSTAQLRLRLVDAKRLNPDTIMPAYHRVQGLNQVGGAWEGKPILTAQQVEDVVAYLGSLK
jgi:L-cysteine S-thiosulfotransferase